MARSPAPTTRVERLVDVLFDGAREESLAIDVADWATGSNRFRDFLETHRDKIRKKFRTATDPEARRDVRTELRVAQLLLADRHLKLAFEARGSTAGGPDFTVTYRGERPFNLEVTRIRGAPESADLARSLLTKLRQLPPGVPNAVLASIDGKTASALDVVTTVRELRRRADAQDEAVLHRAGFATTRAFYDRFLRLGAIVTWCEGAAADARAAAWANPSARVALPDRGLQAGLRCLRAGA